MKKLMISLTLLTLIVVMVAGCAPASSAPASQKVVYLINGSLGDNAFYDSGQKGMEAIKARYGVEIRTIENGLIPPNMSPAWKQQWAMPM